MNAMVWAYSKWRGWRYSGKERCHEKTDCASLKSSILCKHPYQILPYPFLMQFSIFSISLEGKTNFPPSGKQKTKPDGTHVDSS